MVQNLPGNAKAQSRPLLSSIVSSLEVGKLDGFTVMGEEEVGTKKK